MPVSVISNVTKNDFFLPIFYNLNPAKVRYKILATKFFYLLDFGPLLHTCKDMEQLTDLQGVPNYALVAVYPKIPFTPASWSSQAVCGELSVPKASDWIAKNVSAHALIL